MGQDKIEMFDEASLAGDEGVWTIIGTRTEEPKYQVQLGKDAATMKYARSESLLLVRKAETPATEAGFYPDRSIMG